MKPFQRPVPAVAVATVLAFLAVPPAVRAHCDTLDGPVVKDARAALASGDAAAVVKWVRPTDEAAVRDAFRRALAVRALGPEARDLADQFFFETVVRIHRDGEGEPYTGLKPAGTPVDPVIAAADGALEQGSVEALSRTLADEVDAGLRGRFRRAVEARKHASESVAAGRAYVAAYVDFVHHAEQLGVVAGGHQH